MGNICCTDTSDGLSNGKLRPNDGEEYPLQGKNGEPVELPHISERELGNYVMIFILFPYDYLMQINYPILYKVITFIFGA